MQRKRCRHAETLCRQLHRAHLSFATTSPGSSPDKRPQHIAGELMKIMGKIDVTHVPYKGAVVTDVISGRVPMTFQNTGAILPYLKDNRLKGIAVTSL